MTNLRPNKPLRGFMFTCEYKYGSNPFGKLNVEMAVSNGTHPDREEVIDLGKIQYARYHKERYKSDADLSSLSMIVVAIHEFNEKDYFNWIQIAKEPAT